MQPAGIGFEDVDDDEIICNNNANADHQKQMVFMANFVPERLEQYYFSELLRRYPSYIRDVYQKADNERFEDLPRKLLRRQPEPFLTKEELVYMDQWIQKQGTFLTNSTRMAITKQVNQNTNSAVIDITKDAFQNYKLNEDLDEAFEILRKLKGVDNTSASLLLSVAYPENLPHFSRPLYQWIYWDQTSGWNQQFEWTREIYRGLILEIERLKEKYSATAIDIEKVVIVLKHDSALEVLRKEYLTEPLVDRDRDDAVWQGDHTFVCKVLRKGLDGRAGSSAVKAHHKTLDVEISRDRLLAEVLNSYELSKPEKNRNYFVELIGWNETPYYLILAMEFIELGNLEDNLKGVPWKEQDIKETTQQLLEGLKIMHENGIAHRNLSPWSILVASRPPHKIQIKITDFGISKRLSNRETTSLATNDTSPYGYIAPEVARRWITENDNPQKANARYIYTYKADLWSLGCVIFRISAGKPFMKNAAEVLNVQTLKSTVKTIEASLTSFMSAGGIKFVKKLIVIDEKRRYSAESALKGLAEWDIYKGSSDNFSKVTHETPDTPSLEITYTERPRVLAYVRKNRSIKAQQRQVAHSRDMLWLDVNGYAILNVYRHPGDDEVIDYVTNLTPPNNCLIGGDWNVWHPEFEPGVEARNRGSDMVRWLHTSGMTFTGIPGQSTHRAGHVLDLVFTNIPFVETAIVESMATGSDHFTLLSTIPSRGQEAPDRFRYKVREKDLECYRGLIAAGAASLPEVTSAETVEQLDNCVDRLSEVFASASEAVGKPVRERAYSAPWWTKECQEAYIEYKTSERLHPPGNQKYSEEHRHFLSVVRKAKRQYWRNVIDGVSTDKQLYKVVSWHKLGPSLKSPPLKIDGKLIEDTMLKAEALRAEILERFSDGDDLQYDPLEGWTAAEEKLRWETSATMEEVEAHTIGVSSTSPGTDGITVRLLKECWNHIKHYVHGIFEKALQLSYFPLAWRKAEVTMIVKAGKRDRSSPRSWRPISLLSCLGKGLERLVAKRMAWTALTNNIISPQHAGALPRRSAMDLVASFVHETEDALASGLDVSMVTMDVQGAFDALLKRRLLERMRKQGWPLDALRLTDSFLTERAVRVRLEGTVTGYKKVRCGTPQGSPWSPVLYMLYLAELLKQDPKLRFGYADDICLYRTSRSLDENVELLAKDVRRVLQWGDSNKVSFAPEKCEMIHITRKRNRGNPLVVVNEHLSIQPVQRPEGSRKEPALKWLGVWFDRKLTFKRHVAERAGKAMALAQHLRSLANCKHGPPASSLRKAIITCLIPTALYGSEAWYCGRRKPDPKAPRLQEKEKDARVGWHVDVIQRAFTLAAKAILPVWRTTPTLTIFRDAGLPTAQVALDEALWRFSYRLQTVEEGHPLAMRAEPSKIARGPGAGGTRTPRTKVQIAARLLPPIHRPVLVPPTYPPGSRQDPTDGLSKELAARAFEDWYKELPPRDVIIFTDGSQEGSKIGYGFAVYQNGRLLGTGCGRLDPISINFDAEAVGAWKGLKYTNRQPLSLGKQRIWVCLDNTGVIWGLRANAPPSSQRAYLQFHDAAKTHDVIVKWCPGHCNITGNELADKLAKSGAQLEEVDEDCPTTAYGVKALARRMTRDLREHWWSQAERNLSSRYKSWGLKYQIRCPKELDVLTRPTLHHYLAIRTGHGDYAWYHRRFRHPDAKLKCSCGRDKDPQHLVRCRKAQATFDRWPHRPNRRPRSEKEARLYLKLLMSNPQDFKEFLQVTGFYKGICVR